MAAATWDLFLAGLRSEYEGKQLDFTRAIPQFREFAKQLPDNARIPQLLETYEQYRGLGEGCRLPNAEGYFESSAYSILISELLKLKLKPSAEQACAILRTSFHYCGHGGDVDSPVTLAEKAFEEKPYTPEFFDAVRAYQKVLKGTRSTSAQNVKRRLQWILWHDPKEIDTKCWMGRAQVAIFALSPMERFAWEWALRNTTATMNGAAGKAWLKEGDKRLARLGEAEFLARLDEWLRFPPEGAVLLSPTGSCVLRLLVWYGSLVDVRKSLPILLRLADVPWEKREPASKVIGALSWMLRLHGGEAHRAVAERLASVWGDTGEAARLQELYLPDVAAEKKKVAAEKAEQFRSLISALGLENLAKDLKR
jgi:hypothetical protein